MTTFAVEFRRDLPHGRCVAVSLPPAPAGSLADAGDDGAGEKAIVPAATFAQLPDAEQNYARGLAPARRVTWVGGRLALRAALLDLGVDAGAMLSDDRGAPVLPPGTVGSISHKARLAIALAAPDADWSVGIDLEDLTARRRGDISTHVLTETERQAIASLEEPQRGHEVLARFAAKEAIYKAVDRFVRRYVSFQEVTLHRSADGELGADLSLRAGEGPFDIQLAELSLPGFVIATARVRAG
ncbi:MAG TPA: 4'-phosphopantetheinyl transferase superfamily protein [Polyangia bacterium]|nr:4'-phosphopantetheinyl transferase superfamily protein [Polyangia bacterium]